MESTNRVLRQTPRYAAYAPVLRGAGLEESFSIMFAEESPTASAAVEGSTAQARLDKKRDDAIAQLSRYRRFRQGWDGYHGSPFDEALIEKVGELVEVAANVMSKKWILPERFEPGPASDGSIDLEITTSSWRFILTMYPDEPGTVFVEKEGQVSREVTDLEAASLVRQLGRLAP